MNSEKEVSTTLKRPGKPGVVRPPKQEVKINKIFNPYDEENYSLPRKKIIIQPQFVIYGQFLSGGAEVINSNKANLYFYKIPAITIAYHFNNEFSRLVIKENENNEVNRKYNDNLTIVGFFDKKILQYIQSNGSSVTEADKISDSDRPKIKYYAYRLGAIKNKDSVNLKQRTIIPRELFTTINDFVYLLVSCSNQDVPSLCTDTLPLGKPLFWDLPVATSITNGQAYKKSKIILGRIVSIRKLKKLGIDRISGIEDKYLPDNFYAVDEWKGRYEWDQALDVPVPDFRRSKTLNVIRVKTKAYGFRNEEDGLLYACPEIELVLYRSKKNGKKNPVTAFVWHSGNDDDLVKHGYLEDDYQNRYPNVMDSISLATIYESAAAIRNTPPQVAARYIARYLAEQQPDYRSISIDSEFIPLFGGALYYVEQIRIGKVESPPPGTVAALFKINTNHLFYDSPVNYSFNEQELNNPGVQAALYYMQEVLGIRAHSCGCEAVRKIIDGLFCELNALRITADYVISDIEHIGNRTNNIKYRRFRLISDEYNGLGVEDFYNTILFDEVKESFIARDLESRGYYKLNEKKLSDVRTINNLADNSRATYGLYYPYRFSARRNLNIWDAVMTEYGNRLISDYVLTPVKRYYPKAKCAAFTHYAGKGYINQSGIFETYLGGNTDLKDYKSCISAYGGVISEGYRKPAMDNWKMFPNTPSVLSGIISNVNLLRTANHASNDKPFIFITNPGYWKYNFTECKAIKDSLDSMGIDEKSLMLMYYREHLFQILLNEPAGIYAYFVPSTLKYSDETDVPANTKSSYRELQNIINTANNLIAGGERLPLVKELTEEVSPFLISGVRIGEKNVWRISFDARELSSVKTTKNGRTIAYFVNGKTVSFSEVNNDPETIGFNNCGSWIETPADVFPSVETAPRYYRNNPAFYEHRDSFGKEGSLVEIIQKKYNGIDYDVYRFAGFHKHTVFGEAPKRFTSSIRFKLMEDAPLEGELLRFSYSEQDLIVKFKPGFQLSFSKDGVDGKSFTVSPEMLYELNFVITIQGEYPLNEKSKVNLYYYLNSPSDKNWKTQYEQHSFSITDQSSVEYLTSTIDLLRNPVGTSAVEIEDFKVFFTGKHEKIEIFRDTDGLNIGRVNRLNPEYTEMPSDVHFDTSPSDPLVGKFSWLNAENEDVYYLLTYKQGNTEVPLNKHNYRSVNEKHLSSDGRIEFKDNNQGIAAERTQLVLTVKRNSEGSVLIDLPVTPNNVDTVSLSLTEIPSLAVMSNFQEKEAAPKYAIKPKLTTLAYIGKEKLLKKQQ